MSETSQTSGASNPSDAEIKEVLSTMKRVAVVGLSAKEDRASHGVAKFMQGQGFDVVGVNPVLVGQDVMGMAIFATLAEAAAAGPVDVVNVFRRSETVPPVVDAAIAVKADVVWMQEDVVHEEAAAKARAAGLDVIQDRCLYKEWLRLMNG